MSKDYLYLLNSAQIETLDISDNFKFSPDEDQIGVSIVPPCTADIRFQTGKFTLQYPRFNLTPEDRKLPVNWKNFSNDKNEKNKSLLLSLRPVNQGKCGSCFAVAIATTLSDNFLFGMKLNYNPDLSPMYILSCLKDSRYNNICGGGNPAGVVDDIIAGGIATNCCINYYKICDENKYCSGAGKDHLDKTEVTLDQRNSIIDNLGCGCCTNGVHKLYKVRDKIISFSIPDIKHHIMKYGAAVGGFIVYKNFIKDKNKGKFKETNGIYIQSVNYSENVNDIYTPVGGHAISIIGWGSDTLTFKDQYDTNYKNVTIDYWMCRNSWGEKWGDNGYFKYAMYKEFPDTELPAINKNIAFENETTQYGEPGLGGVILMIPDSIGDSDLLKKSPMCNADYTCSEQIVSDDKKFIVVLTEHFFTNRILYLCVLLLIFVCLYYIFFYKEGKTKRKHSSHSSSRSSSRSYRR